MAKRLRVCAVPGCPNFTRTRHCKTHTLSRQERGYGADHDRLRAELQRIMDAGLVFHCWRCGGTIDPSHWHLGHDDHDRSVHRGPECPEKCNLAAAGRISSMR